MTKVSVFGEQPTEQPKELKKIEFVKRVLPDGVIEKPTPNPEDWDNITLFRKKDQFFKYDVILAWDECSIARGIYLGHWNDGVV